METKVKVLIAILLAISCTILAYSTSDQSVKRDSDAALLKEKSLNKVLTDLMMKGLDMMNDKDSKTYKEFLPILEASAAQKGHPIEWIKKGANDALVYEALKAAIETIPKIYGNNAHHAGYVSGALDANCPIDSHGWQTIVSESEIGTSISYIKISVYFKMGNKYFLIFQ